jgi:Zn-dependent protease with chaperone function
MGGLIRFLGVIFAPVLWLLRTLRWIWVALLAIGLPVWIYVTFIAADPVFTVENDVELGRQSEASIAADPEEFPVLSPEDYSEAYLHLGRIVRSVVGSPEIEYAELFPYETVKIIHKDDVLNAFCTPGGFIYVYSGLVHYLDAEDHLAGVLGHEIAHAERRHSTIRLQREFGARRLLEFVVLTLPMTMRDVANAAILKELTTLRYSRTQEAESDDYSVRYLSSTNYACDGTAGFFQKLLDEGGGARIPEFLSDHPEPAARVKAIRKAAEELGCSTSLGGQSGWQAFQASLPAPKKDEAAEEKD